MSRIIDASLGLVSLLGSASVGGFVYDTTPKLLPPVYKALINYEGFAETMTDIVALAYITVLETGLTGLSITLGCYGFYKLYRTVKPEESLDNLFKIS